jgi:hypothetical protein
VVVIVVYSLVAVYTWHLTRPSSFELVLENAKEKLKVFGHERNMFLHRLRVRSPSPIVVLMFCRNWSWPSRVTARATTCKEILKLLVYFEASIRGKQPGIQFECRTAVRGGKRVAGSKSF